MAEETFTADETQAGTELEPQPPIEKKNLVTLIKEWPISRKIALGAAAVLSVVLFAVIILQARTADYQVLYANLQTQDAASVVSWLKGQKTPYQLKNNGKNILIPAGQIYDTRLSLASNGLPSGGGVGFEIFDKQNFALTDFVQKVNYTRAMQGELARTITSLSPVEATRIHLAIPEKRLFKNQQKHATASVIVTLVPGRSLDKAQVQGIVHLVSGSVTGLEAEHVTVIDQSGVVLDGEKQNDKEDILSTDMLAYQQEVEQRLASRAQELLDKALGKNKSMVRVTATLDFAKIEKTEELFDAEEPVIRSEQTQSSNSGSQSSGGIPGVQSNLQGNTQGNTVNSPPSNNNSRITNYEISKTTSKIVNPVGSITKLSVAVLVADKIINAKGDEKKDEKDAATEETKDEENKTTTAPRTAEELKALKNMVISALGLIPARGDNIEVLSMPFADIDSTTMLAQSMPTNLLYEYLPMIKIGLLCFGVLLFYFLLVRPIIKTMKGEVTEHHKTVQEMEEERRIAAQKALEPEEPEEEIYIETDAVLTLRQEVMRNPVPTAYIIKNWILEG